MQEENRKNKLRRWETVSLVILTLIVYLLGCLILIPSEYDYPHRYLTNIDLSWLSYLIVLGFDIGWIILMKRWSYKNARDKIVLTWFILTLSALILTDLFVIGVFRSMW